MSKTQAHAFIEKMNSTPALAAEVQGLYNIKALVALAAREGFQFSVAEWQNVCTDKLSARVEVLCDEELAEVVGGERTPPPPPPPPGRQ